jgi:hypothetical protein
LGRIEICSLKRKFKKFTDQESRPETKAVPVSKIIFEKKAALRKRIWYRALSRVERGILDLTVRYVDSIRSSTLATVVTAIMEKLKLAAESIVDRLVRTVGFSLAQKISAIAVRLGNRLATRWAEDAGFARYLVVSQMNNGRSI